MGFIRMAVTFIRINPIVKPSQNFQNTQTLNLNAASTAALFDFAIELSYGNPGETKRLRIESKPNTNSNPENKELKTWSAIAKIIKIILGEPP